MKIIHLMREKLGDKTLVIAMEEMSELIQELSKNEYGIQDNINMSEEFADALIGIQTLQSKLDIPLIDTSSIFNYTPDIIIPTEKDILNIILDLSKLQQLASKSFRGKIVDKYTVSDLIYNVIPKIYNICRYRGIDSTSIMSWYNLKLIKITTKLTDGTFN